MAWTVKVKNTTASSKTWMGVKIDASAYYQIEERERAKWAEDDKVSSDIQDGTLVVNDGTSDITNATDGWNYFKRAVIDSDATLICVSRTITNSDDPGTTGEICWDSNYLYICVATDTWKRIALSSW